MPIIGIEMAMVRSGVDMAINATTAFNIVLDAVNACSASYGTSNDDMHVTQSITDAVLAADRKVCSVILGVEGHRNRKDYLAEITVTSGGLLPKYWTGGVKIDGVEGEVVDDDELRVLRGNIAAATTPFTTGRYYCNGDYIFYTGTTASLTYENIDLTGTILKAPDEYLYDVCAGALAIVAAKEEHLMTEAGHFAQLFTQCLGMIAQGAVDRPAPQAFRQLGGG